MIERDWLVSRGYYSDEKVYRGPSAFFAGLAIARARRKPRNREVISVWDMNSIDGEPDGETGQMIGSDNKTEEEERFFLICEEIGFIFSKPRCKECKMHVPHHKMDCSQG